jgi:hypothetical protein
VLARPFVRTLRSRCGRYAVFEPDWTGRPAHDGEQISALNLFGTSNAPVLPSSQAIMTRTRETQGRLHCIAINGASIAYLWDVYTTPMPHAGRYFFEKWLDWLRRLIHRCCAYFERREAGHIDSPIRLSKLVFFVTTLRFLPVRYYHTSGSETGRLQYTLWSALRHKCKTPAAAK